MSQLLTWLRVPPGSTFEVALEPEDGEFTSTGQVFRFGRRRLPDQSFRDEDVRPGPKVVQLKASTDYIVDLMVSFVGNTRATATARARVVKSDGTLHGRPRAVELKGKHGDEPETVTIVLVTT